MILADETFQINGKKIQGCQIQDFFPGETNNNFQLRRLYDFTFFDCFFWRNQVRIAISAFFWFSGRLHKPIGSKIPTLKKGWSHLMKAPENLLVLSLKLQPFLCFYFIFFHSFIIFFYGAGWCTPLGNRFIINFPDAWVLILYHHLNVPSGQIGSAWEWYHWKAL